MIITNVYRALLCQLTLRERYDSLLHNYNVIGITSLRYYIIPEMHAPG